MARVAGSGQWWQLLLITHGQRQHRVTGRRLRTGQMTWQILRGSRSFLPSDVIDELAKSEGISV